MNHMRRQSDSESWLKRHLFQFATWLVALLFVSGGVYATTIWRMSSLEAVISDMQTTQKGLIEAIQTLNANLKLEAAERTRDYEEINRLRNFHERSRNRQGE